MKRTHGCAFSVDALDLLLPDECQLIILSFLPLRDVYRIASSSKRIKALVYAAGRLKAFEMSAMRNDTAIKFGNAHGRKIERLTIHGMRISRALSDNLAKFVHLKHLDTTCAWKSPSVNDRFVSVVSKLPLQSIRFGRNEITERGFRMLCNNLGKTLLDLDFNSPTLRGRSFYHIVRLQNLKHLTFRSSQNLDPSVIPFICSLPKLKTLQLSFLPLISGACISTIASSPLKIETLVLNGMYLNEDHCLQLNKLSPSLKILSICHPKISERVLNFLRLENLSVFTIFCAVNLGGLDFLQGLKNLKGLCLYRCGVRMKSLNKWARTRSHLKFDIYKLCPFRVAGVAVEDEQLNSLQNVSELCIMRRPYRSVFYS